MSLLDAVVRAGDPTLAALQSEKKRYSENLSRYLAEEVADGLREAGFPKVVPMRGGPQEKEFQGGFGPKKVDVSYSDERNGLLLAVSIKTISYAPLGKNLKNRFGDLCTEAITLHLRFPYSVVTSLFAFPVSASLDTDKKREVSTFHRAMRLMATISGRRDYTDPGEKFENVALMLYVPAIGGRTPSLRLFDAVTEEAISERDYFMRIREIFLRRNPHLELASLTLDELDGDEEAVD